jgi:hypothetical protein
VDTNLRDHFDRAVSADPGADPGEMAYAAITQGGRIRRRRKTAVAGAAAGLVAVLATIGGVNLFSGPPRSADPPVTVAAAMMPLVAPSCSTKPVASDATDAVVFLTAGVTDGQRSALRSALDDDARVAKLAFENRAQAYQRFVARWRNDPDFLASVGPQQLPESFRLRLADPSRYTAFRAHYAALAGVQDVVGRICPADAPVGGVQ